MNLDHLKPKVDNPTEDQKCEWEKFIQDARDEMYEKTTDMVKSFLKTQKFDYIQNIKNKT
jgi:hypothetical protein